MKQSNRRAVLSGTFCLVLICFVVTLTVAGTRFIFKEKIAAQEWQKQEQSMNQLLPADEYKELLLEKDQEAYRALDQSGTTVGYIFVTESYGYGSLIRVMSGIAEGKVVGIEVLDCTNETPGLGQKVAEDSFKKQFQGVTALPTIIKTAPEEKNEVEAVTGATKSSTAVAEAVNNALDLYQTYAESDKQ